MAGKAKRARHFPRWAWVALVAATICLLFSSLILLRDVWRKARVSQPTI